MSFDRTVQGITPFTSPFLQGVGYPEGPVSGLTV